MVLKEFNKRENFRYFYKGLIFLVCVFIEDWFIKVYYEFLLILRRLFVYELNI